MTTLVEYIVATDPKDWTEAAGGDWRLRLPGGLVYLNRKFYKHCLRWASTNRVIPQPLGNMNDVDNLVQSRLFDFIQALHTRQARIVQEQADVLVDLALAALTQQCEQRRDR